MNIWKFELIEKCGILFSIDTICFSQKKMYIDFESGCAFWRFQYYNVQGGKVNMRGNKYLVCGLSIKAIICGLQAPSSGMQKDYSQSKVQIYF